MSREKMNKSHRRAKARTPIGTNNKMKNKIVFFLILFLFIADRLLKYLSFKGEFFIIPKIFKFTFFANHRLAFSLPAPQTLTIILSIFFISILSLYLLTLFRQQKMGLALALLAVILGALSNLYDRLAFGFVIDYFHLWPISYFNIADLMIGGGIIFFLKDFKGIKSKF